MTPFCVRTVMLAVVGAVVVTVAIINTSVVNNSILLKFFKSYDIVCSICAGGETGRRTTLRW